MVNISQIISSFSKSKNFKETPVELDESRDRKEITSSEKRAFDGIQRRVKNRSGFEKI